MPEGLLIYCQHDGSLPPRQIAVRNLGTLLATWAVHLGGTPGHVEGQLQELAQHIAARAAAARPSRGA